MDASKITLEMIAHMKKCPCDVCQKEAQEMINAREAYLQGVNQVIESLKTIMEDHGREKDTR